MLNDLLKALDDASLYEGQLSNQNKTQYIKKILKRATVQKMTGYLFYGEEIDTDEGDYDKRIKEAEQKLEKITKGDESLLTSFNEIIAIFSDIYAELGLKAGILFMSDVFSDCRKGEKNSDGKDKDLVEKIAKLYGFQIEKIKNPMRFGKHQIRFTVNGIRYRGNMPYRDLPSTLQVEGYVPDIPCRFPKYEKPHKIVLYSRNEKGEWEDTGIRFYTPQEAEEWIRVSGTEYLYKPEK